MTRIRESAWKMETIHNVNAGSWKGAPPTEDGWTFHRSFDCGEESDKYDRRRTYHDENDF